MSKHILYCPICQQGQCVLWSGEYIELTCGNTDCNVTFAINMDLGHNFKAEGTNND